MKLSVSLPANMTATVRLPAQRPELTRVTLDDQPVRTRVLREAVQFRGLGPGFHCIESFES